MNIALELTERKPYLWINPSKSDSIRLDMANMLQAKEDWNAFASLLQELFGTPVIDSPLKSLSRVQMHHRGKHFLKEDAVLPVAGSIKARGGFFEVIYHAREIALHEGLVSREDSMRLMASQQEFFSKYALHVASTGNLGLSIGLMGRSLGFQVFVHMSSDAKDWKKELLRSRGAEVIEYDGDYSEAVIRGREAAAKNVKAYFVDDERSLRLFWGYSKAGYDLQAQLPDDISQERPLFVSIPCGVGGAPGGIAYALKAIYGNRVHIFFAEPIEAPAVLLGMATEKGEGIRVQDIGLTGKTLADGLAVGKPSEFVCRQMKEVLSGIYTVRDEALQAMQYLLYKEEGIKCEPSACAGVLLSDYMQTEEGRAYLQKEGVQEENIRYVYWATGGALVPEEIFSQQLEEGKKVLQERPDIFEVD